MLTTRTGRAAGLAALGLAAGLALGGCDSSSPSGQTATTSGPAAVAGAPAIEETGPHAAGKTVFRAQNCGRCHPLPGFGPPMGGPPGRGGFAGGPPMGPGGPGGPPGGFGGPPGGPGGGPGGRGGMRRPPDLSKVGADPEHTVEWLMAHVRSPKTHNPESTMPPYDENKINDNDLRALAEFLASLHGDEGGEAKEGGTKEGESNEAEGEGNASP